MKPKTCQTCRRAVDLLRELRTGINVLATICDVEGLWAGKVRANEMKKDLDMFFGEMEELQRREDFGPNGDATTPGFFKRDSHANKT